MTPWVCKGGLGKKGRGGIIPIPGPIIIGGGGPPVIWCKIYPIKSVESLSISLCLHLAAPFCADLPGIAAVSHHCAGIKVLLTKRRAHRKRRGRSPKRRPTWREHIADDLEGS
jgi:hypothetical protein